MNKTILTGSISVALGIFAGQVYGQTLTVDNTTVDSISVKSFSYDAGSKTLTIDTVSGDAVLVASDETGGGETGGGETGGGETGGGETGGGESGGGESGGGESGGGESGGGAPIDGVVLDYSFGDWFSDTRQREIVIPQGAVLASKFTATASTRLGGMMTFQTPTGAPKPLTDYWVSLEPNGAAISSACANENQSFSYAFRWSQYFFRDYVCEISPGTTYYLNMKHSDPEQPASRLLRTLKNNGIK